MKRLVSVFLTMFFVGFMFQMTAQAYTKKTAPLMTEWGEALTPDNVHQEYPRPQLVRDDWMNLNGIWQFQGGSAGESLPSGTLSEEILVPFPVESALSGIMRREPYCWYKRSFEVPSNWSGQDIMLNFGAVDWESEVYINGTSLGVHRGGYDTFSYNITPYLNATGTNELAVRVYDPTDTGYQPRGKQVRYPKTIYYTSVTGIWQTVWLEPVAPQGSIENLLITPDIDEESVSVTVNTKGSATDGLTATVEVLNEGTTVNITTGSVTSAINISVPSPRLWSPDDPFLYDVKVTLMKDGAILDEATSYMGMRKIEKKYVDGYNKILLNNEFVFHNGMLDQGYWPDGLYTAPSDDALKYDIEKTKEMGYNMLRKHVKIEPARWYYWADKLGVLVWQDMPNGENNSTEGKTNFENELKAMIDDLRHFPSVVMWVVFNEAWGQYDTPRLTNWVKTYDPSRIVSNASGWTDKNVGDILDIHSYPAPNVPTDSQRAVVCGEYGGVKYAIENHTWSSGWGYTTVDSSEALMNLYEGYLTTTEDFVKNRGLSGIVYTQVTDVEIELNGLMTYDRKILKVDPARMTALNAFNFGKSTVIPTSQETAQTWRYTTSEPSSSWTASNFDDTSWSEGPGGFGTSGTPGSTIGTTWNSSKIWIRRTFDLPALSAQQVDNLLLKVHHDEDTEVYINGVLAFSATGYTTTYTYQSLSDAAKNALVLGGTNTIAVYCKQTLGGQYIDVGLSMLGDYVPPVTPEIFQDDFNDGNADGWTSISGQWTVSNNKLNVPNYRGGKILANNKTATNFILRTDVSLANNSTYSDAGFFFRASDVNAPQDQLKGYYVGIDANLNRILLGKFNNNWTFLESSDMTIDANTTYQLQVKVVGTTISVYVNNLTTPLFTYEDSTYSSGGFGLRVYQTDGTFDNVYFETLE